MNFVAKCSALWSLAYQVHVNICNPIPLIDFAEHRNTHEHIIFRIYDGLSHYWETNNQTLLKQCFESLKHVNLG